MTVRDHIAVLTGPIVIAIEEKDGRQLYKGFKGVFEHENHKEILDREVARFKLRTEGKRRTKEEERSTITELNCGVFNYADLHVENIYVYILA